MLSPYRTPEVRPNLVRQGCFPGFAPRRERPDAPGSLGESAAFTPLTVRCPPSITLHPLSYDHPCPSFPGWFPRSEGLVITRTSSFLSVQIYLTTGWSKMCALARGGWGGGLVFAFIRVGILGMLTCFPGILKTLLGVQHTHCETIIAVRSTVLIFLDLDWPTAQVVNASYP